MTAAAPTMHALELSRRRLVHRVRHLSVVAEEEQRRAERFQHEAIRARDAAIRAARSAAVFHRLPGHCVYCGGATGGVACGGHRPLLAVDPHYLALRMGATSS